MCLVVGGSAVWRVLISTEQQKTEQLRKTPPVSCRIVVAVLT